MDLMIIIATGPIPIWTEIMYNKACMAIAAEVVPGEEDIEAAIDSWVQQQTDAIAAQVQQRIMQQAVQADVVDDPAAAGTYDRKDPSTPTRNRWRWIAAGVVLAIVIGLVVALVVVFVPTEEPPTLASTPTSSLPPPIPEVSSRLSNLQE